MRTITRRCALKAMATVGLAAPALGCANGTAQDVATLEEEHKAGADAAGRRIRILATSDVHGMFCPWDYAAEKEYKKGSLAQVSTVVKELYDKDTILVDAGDAIQGNMNAIFLADEVHPMVLAMNKIGYELFTMGNHEFNYGMDVVRKTAASLDCPVLCGNVVDENGDMVGEAWTIIERDGVRVGLIGMVTPNIVHWDAANLEGCEVSDPIERTRAAIDEIKDDVDVLVGVMHIGLNSELENKNSGVRAMAESCPEFDAIVAAHTHVRIEGEDVAGVRVVENAYHAHTLSVIDIDLVPDGDGWKVAGVSSRSVDTCDYEPDEEIVELMAPFDERARAYMSEVIGELEGGPLAPPNEIKGLPQFLFEDTPLLDLFHRVQLHYSGADVSMTAAFEFAANISEGEIRRSAASSLYPYENTLYKLEVTGAQLKTLMEWAAAHYRRYEPGDLTLGIVPKTYVDMVDTFEGLNYELDVSKETGERILNLRWSDGTPIVDDDVFTLACNNYRANTSLLEAGKVFEADDLPKLLEIDVAGNIGGMRDLICDYIENVCNGLITAEVDDNWHLVGIDWDPELHRRAVELIANGTFHIWDEAARLLPDTVVTEDDLADVTGA